MNYMGLYVIKHMHVYDLICVRSYLKEFPAMLKKQNTKQTKQTKQIFEKLKF